MTYLHIQYHCREQVLIVRIILADTETSSMSSNVDLPAGSKAICQIWLNIHGLTSKNISYLWILCLNLILCMRNYLSPPSFFHCNPMINFAEYFPFQRSDYHWLTSFVAEKAQRCIRDKKFSIKCRGAPPQITLSYFCFDHCTKRLQLISFPWKIYPPLFNVLRKLHANWFEEKKALSNQTR